MKRWKLITQISVIFTIVTVIISLIFVVIFEVSLQRAYQEQNLYQLQEYLMSIKSQLDRREPVLPSEHNGYVIYMTELDLDTRDYHLGKNPALISDDIEFKSIDEIKTIILSVLNKENIPENTYEERKLDKVNHIIVGESYKLTEEHGYYVFVFTDNRFIKSASDEFAQTLRFTGLALIILGNVILLLWARLVVGRISHVQSEIGLLVKTNYERPITIDGRDEIAELATSVEDMRKEILEHEQTKREIMQNISHDFKTPISVIKTYGEAIKDGISNVDEIDVIIRQADILNHKVVQLLQLNKINYLTSNQELEKIYVKEIIQNIVEKHKYNFDKEFVLQLDNSTYHAAPENLEIAIGNIIDNAMRYAKTKIVIILNNKKLTIYNDGEQIDEAFIEKIFKPYEKGSKGEFGLGMSITQQTLAFYDLTVSVKNVRKGVMFVIEPI